MTTEAGLQLYRDHHPRLLALLRAELPCDADADAVAHEAWKELFRAMQRTDVKVRDPWALLITIGKRRACDWWRDNKTERDQLQREADPGDTFARLPETLDMLSSAIKRREFVDEPISNAALRAAVMELPPRRRLAVFLRYLVGWDVVEVAEYMCVTPRRVNQLLNCALQKLRSSSHVRGYSPKNAARRTEARP